MPSSELFLIALATVLALPWLIWRLGRTDAWAPLVVVQILTGIALGPGLFGAAFPEIHRTVLNEEVIAMLGGVASWGVILFVWIAGTELDLSQAWRERRDSTVTAGLAMLGPLVLGGVVGMGLLWHAPGWMGPSASSWQFVAAIGMACSVTALPILILFMERLEILRKSLGQRVLRYASLDDLAIWGLLALILVDLERLGKQAAFLGLFFLATVILRRALPRLNPQDRWFLSLVWLALCALAADWAGLHYMVGAFLAGAVLEADWLDQQRLDRLREMLLLVMMPVFFLYTGLRTEWQLGGASVFAAAAALLLAGVGGKLLGLRLAGRILDWPPGQARLIGWLLQTKALIMIIFANILLDRAVISAETFTALLLMAAASTMLTIPMAQRAMKHFQDQSPEPSKLQSQR
ncbi:cation:proton antiporter [Wenzhouxiangella marina]|uniref:Cation/proton exchanger n=1 Tax=Wenzhouxiangella marina TaxID=1579979 RepID=A0A0K0XT50_9GAMM|nr:cation:proton antiporter [Wenzhouxiangella marina]AKS40835.1 Cation/proton exchanger [Wenzhouxiangella marina]MBB6087709.1 Kef-type K+ transport system membrane component KefB [Wenzhouxiangella marina]